MEETKTTRGRKPKSTNIDTNDMATMMAKMQEQIEMLQQQLKNSEKNEEKANKEKTDLQQLVEALQSNQNTDKVLPKKVKVVSLLPNKYNLTTEKDGQGKQFTFEDFGDVITMKTSELEEILSIQHYREQAEKGYFYILDKDIVDDQELSEAYLNIKDKDTINNVMNLVSDECVDIFCGLARELQESLSVKMAEMLISGVRLDRNRIADISMKTDIDIENIANSIKKTNKSK